MKSPSKRGPGRNPESGYALVMIMFFMALLVLGMAAAAPTVLSNIQREREEELVWRGKQYVRGIKLYYMKVHRFPTSLEDLTEAKTGIRFMRQAYKDPMNPDGSWRLIYVGPNGQLIGSLINHNYGLGNQFGAPPGNVAGANPSLFGSATNAAGGSSFGGGFQNSSFGGNSGQFGSNNVGGATATAPASQDTQTPADPSQIPNLSDAANQPQPIGGMMDASNTVGGNIIGVGSKVDRKSFRWYEKAKNYKQFEFVWDPSKDRMMGGASRGIGTPLPNTNGAPGMSAPPPASGQTPAPTSDPNSNPPLQAPPPNQ